MKPVLEFVISHWLIITILMSVFWGLRGAYSDYRGRMEDFLMTKMDYPPWYVRTGFVLIWSTYQFILNFIGSVVGWCCLYILIVRIQPSLLRNFDLSDFFLFIFSFLGITGLLPQSFYGLVGSLEKLAELITGRLLK